MISRPHLTLGVSLAASSALGASVRTGRLDLGRAGWLHHGLYAATLAAAVGAITFDARQRRHTWPVAAGTLGVLAALPATSGGSKAHIAVAAAASAVFVVGTVAVTR